MARTSFTLVMLCVAGAMALLLGIVGIYGVISYSVSQRTREIGIRMALGAQRPTLTAMFVRQGLQLTGIGIICGLVVAFISMRLMSSILFNVSPVDPITYAVITVGVIATAYLACYLPSRRAATVDPVHAGRIALPLNGGGATDDYSLRHRRLTLGGLVKIFLIKALSWVQMSIEDPVKTLQLRIFERGPAQSRHAPCCANWSRSNLRHRPRRIS
jgi:hypothetical protein